MFMIVGVELDMVINDSLKAKMWEEEREEK